MLALLTSFGSKVWGYVLLVGGIIAAGLAAFFSVKKSGETEQKTADMAQTTKTVEEAHETQNTVAAEPDADVDSGLQQWDRDK